MHVKGVVGGGRSGEGGRSVGNDVLCCLRKQPLLTPRLPPCCCWFSSWLQNAIGNVMADMAQGFQAAQDHRSEVGRESGCSEC